ncbi:MAG TPA: type VI secretion system baseplate subunit TssE [Paenalcaligenes sp.]|nr:type VI secretion system baseplate subunit TssE [Paenalcaligenes sp.]
MYKNARDRLQPALLDRLRDDRPEQGVEAQQRWVLSFEQLKQAVLRDLAWLLNTISVSAHDDLAAYPHVQQSTLNYGVAALAGKRLSEIEWTEVEFAVHDAIVQFEPRILQESLSVRCLSTATDIEHHNVIALLIRGQLWANPYPRELLVRTEIDLESGQIALEEIDEEQ